MPPKLFDAYKSPEQCSKPGVGCLTKGIKLPKYMGVIISQYRDPYIPISILRDPAVRLGSFGFKKVKKNLKAVHVASVPLRFGSSRFKKRFGSMSAIRVLPESNSNLGHSLPKPSFLELLSRSG